MRSFIKSHRRSESSSSEAPEDLDQATLLLGISKASVKPANSTKSNRSTISTGSIKTPMHSPSVAASGQFTPPPLTIATRSVSGSSFGSNVVSTPLSSVPPSVPGSAGTTQGGGSALSSPKKLLTPIKNLFSSSKDESRERRRLKTNGHARSYSHGSITNLSSLSSSNSAQDLYSLSSMAKPNLSIHTTQQQQQQQQQQQPPQLPQQPPPQIPQQAPPSVPPQAPTQQRASAKKTTRKSRNPFSTSHTNPQASKPYTLHSSSQSKTSSISAASAAAAAAAAAMAAAKANKNARLAASAIASKPSTVLPKLKPPISLPSVVPKQDNSSTSSLATNDSRFESKSVSFRYDGADKEKPQKYDRKEKDTSINEEHFDYEDYDGEDDDSSSSQFSFVKDRRGGRNTSVKYYKTPKTPTEDQTEFTSNTFNENDLGYEVDEFSDYDFENNGMSDLDDGQEEDVKYNELFDDEVKRRESVKNESRQEYQNDEYDDFEKFLGNDSQTEDQMQDAFQGPLIGHEYQANLESESQPVHQDHTGNNEATTPETEEAFETNPTSESELKSEPLDKDHESTFIREPLMLNEAVHLKNTPSTPGREDVQSNGITYEDDILENYLYFSKSPSVRYSSDNAEYAMDRLTPHDSHEDSASSEQLDLFETDGPAVNGLTIRTNSINRRSSTLASTMASSHNEDEENEDTIVLPRFEPVKEEETKVNPRNSINLLMNMLSQLEAAPEKDGSTPEEDEPDQTKHEARDSTLRKMASGIDEAKMLPQSAQRSSILDMMSLLSNLERSQAEIVEVSNKASERAEMNRRSIVDMMSTLASLEGSKSAPNKRNSINNMMQTIAKLDLSNIENNRGNEMFKNKKTPLDRLKANNAPYRYSWFNNDETIFKAGNSPPREMNGSGAGSGEEATSRESPDISTSSSSVPSNSARLASPVSTQTTTDLFVPAIPQAKRNESDLESEVSDTDAYKDVAYNRALDQDLIDEINQIPEDFDFEEHNYRSRTVRETPEFFRSNSYNKKPLKALMDSKFQANKIETQNKTVTFYRSNSTGGSSSLDVGRSRSVSRAPSMRSMNSFVSVNEDHLMEEEEEEEYNHETHEQGDLRSRRESRETDDYRKVPHFKLNINPSFNLKAAELSPKSPTNSLNNKVTESRLRNQVLN